MNIIQLIRGIENIYKRVKEDPNEIQVLVEDAVVDAKDTVKEYKEILDTSNDDEFVKHKRKDIMIRILRKLINSIK